MVSRRCVNGSSSHSTVTVPDSIFDRSRMSLIRFSRSVPAPWMVLANSTCRLLQIAVGVLGQLLAQDQDAVERRAQLVRHVGQELRLVARGQRQLRRLLLQRAPRQLDFLVLALDLGVLLGQQPRLGGQFLVGLLQLLLLRLQLAGQLLRLLQQALGAHGRLDGVEHHADAAGELLEERQLRGGELAQRGQLDHRLDLAFVQHRQHDDVARACAAPGRERTWIGIRRDVGQQHALPSSGALADQALAECDSGAARALVAAWIGVARELLQMRGIVRAASIT